MQNWKNEKFEKWNFEKNEKLEIEKNEISIKPKIKNLKIWSFQISNFVFFSNFYYFFFFNSSFFEISFFKFSIFNFFKCPFFKFSIFFLILSRLGPDWSLVPDKNLDLKKSRLWTKSGLVSVMDNSGHEGSPLYISTFFI